MIIEIKENMQNIRLDKLLASKLDLSRNVISNSKIYINDILVKSNSKAKLGDIVKIELYKKDDVKVVENDIPIKILYEDEYLAVINKPYNLVVHPSESNKGDTLAGSLVNIFPKLSNLDPLRPGIVHRLDKDTSGLMIIAKDNETHIKLQEMFKEHNLDKIYLAILKGCIRYENYLVENYIGRDRKDRKKISSNTDKGKLAISEFKKIASNDKISLVSVKIKTGRTHQIRVHAKELGFPVLGDNLYLNKTKENRQKLHSYYLKFIHPITREMIELKTDMPDDMKQTLKKYGLGDIDARI